MNWVARVLVIMLTATLAVALITVAVLFYQGKRRPSMNSDYVALGSSFAAGLGLGDRAPGSPFVCMRSVNGYPQQVARLLGITFSDMTCSGATIKDVLLGGQAFLGPQIDALGPETRLVTITAGGNDVGYVGGLTAMAYRRRGGIFGLVAGRFANRDKAVEDDQFRQLSDDMAATFHEVKRRAPSAAVFVLPYPTILPTEGTCSKIGISADDVARMRPVGQRLLGVTRRAAVKAGVTLIDMSALSNGHDACSGAAWVNGSTPVQGSPFHPTFAGARAAAGLIVSAFRNLPPQRTKIAQP